MTFPLIFASIPAVGRTLPTQDADPSVLYLRGIAPFLDLSSEIVNASKTAENTNADNIKYHPYKALRLRGFIHNLPSSELRHDSCGEGGHIMDPELPIPGFGRVFFMLYKPTTRYLVKVLEYHMGDFGDNWSIYVSNHLANAEATPSDPPIDPELGLATVPSVPTTTVAIAEVVDGSALAHDPGKAEKILQDYLDHLLTGSHEVDAFDDRGARIFEKNADGIPDFAKTQVPNFPLEEMTRDRINAMEESFLDMKSLMWEDIEYAYAYEGAVMPGGQLMMGRWWRVGLAGMGINEGFEIDADGHGVEIRSGEPWIRIVTDEDDDMIVDWEGLVDNEYLRRGRKKSRGLERGPFCFWT